MRARIMILCVVIVAACSRASSPLPFGAGSQSLLLGARPDTLHVDPLFNFDGGTGGGNKKEPVKPIGQGGAGGLVGDPDVALYGVTTAGGDLKCNAYDRPATRNHSPRGCGVVFELRPQKNGAYKETVLSTFTGSNGKVPSGRLLKLPDGLYGATLSGGAYGQGAIFKVTPSGPGFTESVIYSFKGHKDGSAPLAPLVSDNGGTLYGTSGGGGICYRGMYFNDDCGTVFKLTPSGSGYVKTTLYTFKGKTDGIGPSSGLLRDSDGALYGTTYGGGDEHCGYFGGGCGTVFELTRTSSGYSEKILHVFGKRIHDGYYPEGGLIADKSGDLFGTTPFGGSYGCVVPPPEYSGGCGTIYELTPSGSRYTEKVVHVFTEPAAGQGVWPQTSLTVGSDGYLYGTAVSGGDFKCGAPGSFIAGCGTVYRLAPGHPPLQSLYQFPGGKDGSQPSAPLLYFDGVLYGETLAGGTKGHGTVFKLPL
jgi:uncharacterized repeat protein (TIGR03803 family)